MLDHRVIADMICSAPFVACPNTVCAWGVNQVTIRVRCSRQIAWFYTHSLSAAGPSLRLEQPTMHLSPGLPGGKLRPSQQATAMP
jgi:hypothetical protein